jgi:hypothetical protein
VARPPPKAFPGISRFSVSVANYIDWKKQNSVFEDMAIFSSKSINLTGDGKPELPHLGAQLGQKCELSTSQTRNTPHRDRGLMAEDAAGFVTSLRNLSELPLMQS